MEQDRIKRFSIREIIKPNDSLSNENHYEITGIKYEIDPDGMWVNYNDVRNILEDNILTIGKLKEVIDLLLGKHRV